jgi:hypothetical protein
VATKIAEKANQALLTRQGVLSSDQRVLAYIESDLAMFATDMERDLEMQVERLDNILLQMQGRMEGFLSEHLTLGNLRALLNPRELGEQFAAVVTKRVEDDVQVNELRAREIKKKTYFFATFTGSHCEYGRLGGGQDATAGVGRR